MRLIKKGLGLNTFVTLFEPFADKGNLSKEDILSLRQKLSDTILKCSEDDLEFLVQGIIEIHEMFNAP